MTKLLEDGKAERYVLGAAMANTIHRQHVLENMTKEMFFDDYHALMFEAIKFCEEKGVTPNFEAVEKAVFLGNPEAKHWTFKGKDGDEVVDISLERYLWSSQKESHSIIIEEYMKIVMQHYARRYIVQAGIELSACKEDDDVRDKISECLNKLEKISTIETKNYTTTGDKLLENYSDGLSLNDWLSKKKADRLDGVPNIDGVVTKFYELDMSLGGLAPSRLIVVGARAGVGKTEFLCQLIAKVIAGSVQCSAFTLEMSRKEYFLRIAGILLGKNYALLNYGDFDAFFDAEKKHVLSTKKKELSHLSIVDASGLTVEEFGAMVRREVRKKDSKVIFLDHLGLLRPPRGNMPRYEAVSYNSNTLKTIAMQNNVCIVAACQLNRESEKRNNPTPQLHDLRDSGDIEQDADQVILLSRKDETILADIKKNRHSPCGYVVFDYNLSTQKMKEQV